MEPGIDIRRRADGSIDIDHYASIARVERIATTRRCAWAIIGLPSNFLSRVATKVVAIRTVGFKAKNV